MRVAERFDTPAGPDIVWGILADVEHWREWTPTVTEIKSLSQDGLKVGARYRVVQPKLRPSVYEVTECVPNQRFTWMQKLPGGGLIGDHRVSKSNGATEVELSFRSEGLIANVVAGLFSKLISGYVATEARSLKSRCDNVARR